MSPHTVLCKGLKVPFISFFAYKEPFFLKSQSLSFCIWTLAAFSLNFTPVIVPDHFWINVSLFVKPLNTNRWIIQA